VLFHSCATKKLTGVMSALLHIFIDVAFITS